MKAPEIIQTDKYIIRIYDEYNYMEYIIREGITLDVEDIRKAKELVVALRPGVKFYVYGEGVEFFTLTKEARELCATKEHSDNTIAIAFYTKNVSLLLLGEIFNKINKPVVPTRIFNDRKKAKAWLSQQMGVKGKVLG
jgi:hypothetical protein